MLQTIFWPFVAMPNLLPTAFTNSLRRDIKIRKRISMPGQELGGVQPMRSKRRRRRRRKAGRSPGKKKREIEGGSQLLWQLHTSQHYSPDGARSVPILRMCSIPLIVLPGAPRIVGAFRKGTPLYPTPCLGVGQRTRTRKSFERGNFSIGAAIVQITRARSRSTCGPRDQGTDARGMKYKRMIGKRLSNVSSSNYMIMIILHWLKMLLSLFSILRTNLGSLFLYY